MGQAAVKRERRRLPMRPAEVDVEGDGGGEEGSESGRAPCGIMRRRPGEGRASEQHAGYRHQRDQRA
jgi:hypothetical protein